MASGSKVDLNLRYLQAELTQIDLLIRREVLKWQKAGQDINDEFRGLYLSDSQAAALLNRPFGTNWGNLGILSPEEQQAFTNAHLQAEQQVKAARESARQSNQGLRLAHLVRTFGLDEFEANTLLICLAPNLDLRYERLYGFLQDDVTRKHPSVNLILDLLAPQGPERLQLLPKFADDAQLFKYRLLEKVDEGKQGKSPLLSQSLYLDPAIVSWLLGKYQPHMDIKEAVSLQAPNEAVANHLFTAETWEKIAPALGHKPVIVYYGVDNATKHAAAHRVAAQLGQDLLHVDLTAAINAGLAPDLALRLALRDALLSGALPYLTGWDANLTDSSPPASMLSEICNYPGTIIIGGQSQWQAKGIDRDRTLLWVEFPLPDYTQRKKLWRHYLKHHESSIDLNVTPLAGQFLLTTGQVRDAVATARDMAAQQNEPLKIDALFTAARIHSNPKLAGMARKIDPRYTWEDIILPPDQLTILKELVSTVRERSTVLEEWGVGKKLTSSRGVTVLFAGPPGTGKTMSAEVIAGELSLDLYKIDLSTVVSKYIGETEKNLERIFNEAQSSNAILFFDEADALFGKRSEVKDAHDRYANLEISYLLQRMEAYDGVTILATNLKANMDDAFTRRLQFSVSIPFPEEEYRFRIWETLFPPDVPRASDLDFRYMASRFKLSGGNIRNVIVSAAYLAAAENSSVTMKHLLHGTRRELQKMGRLVNEEDLQFTVKSVITNN